MTEIRCELCRQLIGMSFRRTTIAIYCPVCAPEVEAAHEEVKKHDTA